MKDDTAHAEKKEELKKSSRQDTIEKHLFEDDDQFTSLLNQPLQKDIRDPVALGIYCYLMSLPPNWKIIPAQVGKHFKMGIATVRKKLKVLIELGYVFYGQESDNGRFGCGRYLIFQRALNSVKREKIQKMFPKVKKPRAVLPRTVECNNTKETSVQMKETTNPEPAVRESLSLFDKKQPYMKHLTAEEVEPFMKYVEAHKHEADNLKAWMIDCAKKKYWLTATATPEQKAEAHKQLTHWIVQSFPGRKDIDHGYNYIEFINGMTSVHLKFGEKNFEKTCEEELAKRKLSLSLAMSA